jgi:signal transduction histidine kinase
VLYGAYAFGKLRDAAKKMSGGNLEEKIDCKYLPGCFGEFAGHLNALGDTCIEAAKQQMQSERMKSELITNVSHDIKTPLTSIINYVDLLQMTDDEAQRAEYLEVLSRQSQRLKKLIEDLMEMSRASSGNVAVEMTPTDISEAVNQALGEFADTLESCGLKTMCRMPAEPVMALCDGKHLWRVLSNVLSNVVKYALPGTRVYVDVARQGQKVEISIKNISAQMLNITAGELMERFVRGDASRNTEGNGLGLNIAKSLMELQNGRLDLVVDGDLFKVVLTLNAA